MENLLDKLNVLDGQIATEFSLYQELIGTEHSYKEDWSEWSLHREKDIFGKIHELQAIKARMVSGEKLPDIVYRDREVVKYEDRVVEHKDIHVYKSGLAQGIVGASIVGYILIGFVYYFGLFTIIINK